MTFSSLHPLLGGALSGAAIKESRSQPDQVEDEINVLYQKDAFMLRALLREEITP